MGVFDGPISKGVFDGSPDVVPGRRVRTSATPRVEGRLFDGASGMGVFDESPGGVPVRAIAGSRLGFRIPTGRPGARADSTYRKVSDAPVKREKGDKNQDNENKDKTHNEGQSSETSDSGPPEGSSDADTSPGGAHEGDDGTGQDDGDDGTVQDILNMASAGIIDLNTANTIADILASRDELNRDLVEAAQAAVNEFRDHAELYNAMADSNWARNHIWVWEKGEIVPYEYGEYEPPEPECGFDAPEVWNTFHCDRYLMYLLEHGQACCNPDWIQECYFFGLHSDRLERLCPWDEM